MGGRVFATSDWHGCLKAGAKALEWLQSDDTLYFLGDSMDRGEDGINVYNALANDDRVIMLKGNHEEFFEKYIPQIIRDENSSEWMDLWLGGNGGWATMNSIEKLGYTDEFLMIYVKNIREMPTRLVYYSPNGHTVVLEHAGHTPLITDLKYHEPLWNREHFSDNWTKNSKMENWYLVHGHTPTMYLRLEYGYKDMKPLTDIEIQHRYDWWREENKKIMIPEVIRYCDGHKFDIDMCTIVSGRVALLDLDSFETIYFDAEDK